MNIIDPTRLNSNAASYIVQMAPPAAGAIIPFEGMKYHVRKKPSAFHLWMMRICFGWKWEDA